MRHSCVIILICNKPVKIEIKPVKFAIKPVKIAIERH